MSLPQDWTEDQLQAVASLTMGQSPDSKYYSEEEIGLPFLQGCAEFQDRHPKHALYCSQAKKSAPLGSILFSVRAPVGRMNIADREYIIGRGLAAIRGSQLNQSYLEQYLRHEEPRFRVASQGSTFEAINSSELGRWPIEYPLDSGEQSKIAEVLSTVDRAIEQTAALIAKQQRIKTGLMQDLLTRGIDAHGNLRSEETHEFKDSPLGRIPVEWDAVTIGAHCKVKRGASPRPIQDPKWWGGEVGWVRIADVTASRKYLRKTTQQLSVLGVRHSILLQQGEVILSICATIGRPIITTYPVCIHDGFVWFEGLSDNIDREWFYYYLQGKEEHLAGSRQVGTQGNLNTGIVSRTALLLPRSQEEQTRIAATFRATDETIEHWLTALAKLRSLKTGLMQDLLTGKVRVTPLLEKEREAVTA